MMRAVWLLFALLAIAPAAHADEKQALRDLLDYFLANAAEPAAHERFWGEDLVYTSSAGARFGKADILAAMAEEPAEPGPEYSAAAVDVRLYDDIAVVAFRLVATAADGSTVNYFNTGTFARRDNRWEAIAWQATRIPEADD